MKSFPVKTFLTHLRPHLDEIAARWMFLCWGNSIFPGADKSEIKYLTTGVLPDDVPPEALEEKGILPVGVGGGFLDEHPVEGLSRKVGECAATLVSNALKLQNDKPLQHVLEEIRHCDLTNQVKPTQLSSLVKLRHRRNPSDAPKVLEWTMRAIEALHKNGAKQVARDVYRGEAKQVFDKLLIEHRWDNVRSVEHVWNLISQSEGNSHIYLTELVHIFKTLNRRTKRKSKEWLQEAIVDMYHDSVEFFKAVDVVNDRGNVTEFLSEGETFPVLTIHSDTDHISQAARSRFCGYIALVIQRNTKGNTAIFLNTYNPHVKKEGLHLDDLIRMIRLREQTRLGYPQSQWQSLVAEGTLRRVRMWYYSKDGDMILNGSTTTPDVKPSRLSLSEILDTAQHAFKRELVWKWRKQHAVASELQRHRGSFRTALVKNPARFKLGASVNHVSVNLPTQQEVFAELERIMVS